MNKTTVAVSALFIAALTSGSAQAFDPENGKQLVNANCLECHGTEVYTREDRRVKSRKGLTTQVKRCEQALGLTWFDNEVEDTAEFLNHTYYKFAK